LRRIRKDPRSQKSGIRKHITKPKAGELDDSVVVQDDGLARQHRLTIHHHRSHALAENEYFNEQRINSTVFFTSVIPDPGSKNRNKREG
jgi:hypothetical protein